MTRNEKLVAMEAGLKSVVDDLMAELWVSFGKDIAALTIIDDLNGITVIPIKRDQFDFLLALNVQDTKMYFKWQAIHMVASADGSGVYEADVGQANQSEMAIAAGLVLSYYAEAKVAGDTAVSIH